MKNEIKKSEKLYIESFHFSVTKLTTWWSYWSERRENVRWPKHDFGPTCVPWTWLNQENNDPNESFIGAKINLHDTIKNVLELIVNNTVVDNPCDICLIFYVIKDFLKDFNESYRIVQD